MADDIHSILGIKPSTSDKGQEKAPDKATPGSSSGAEQLASLFNNMTPDSAAKFAQVLNNMPAAGGTPAATSPQADEFGALSSLGVMGGSVVVFIACLFLIQVIPIRLFLIGLIVAPIGFVVGVVCLIRALVKGIP